MKIQIRDYLRTGKLLEDVVIMTANQYIETIQGEDSHYQKTGELDINLTINGVEINAEEFFNVLHNHVERHENKFEEWKAKWISKNSDAAKQEKLIKEFQKANQMLQNINEKLK